MSENRDMSQRWPNLGIAPGMIGPGLSVMVCTGAALLGAAIICYATVAQAADADDTWWLDVHAGGIEPLPQMYRADEILGIPAAGLTPRPIAS
jgi:hypothetical protein